MATDNRLWGAERIRGELLKLGIRVSKRTIQKYMRSLHRRRGGQTWSTFVKTTQLTSGVAISCRRTT